MNPCRLQNNRGSDAIINLVVVNMGPGRIEQTIGELQKELWNKTTYEDVSKVVSTNIAGSYFTFLTFLGCGGSRQYEPRQRRKEWTATESVYSTTSFGGLCRAAAPSYV